jgi:hypothetical protein
VEDIARQRLASDPNLINLSQDAIYRELMGEIDRSVAQLIRGGLNALCPRYPILERAVAEAPLLSEASFSETIRSSVQRVLEENSENHGEH